MIVKKRLIGLLFFFILISFSLSLASGADVEFNDDENEVYINGNSVNIYADGAGTHVKTTDGFFNYNTIDISDYTIYGGSKDNSYSGKTDVEVQGGTLENIYGGNRGVLEDGKVDTKVSDGLKTNVVINGGKFGDVYGGNYKGDVTNGQFNLEIKGTSNNKLEIKENENKSVFGGSHYGNILETSIEVIISDVDAITPSKKIYSIFGGNRLGEISNFNKKISLTISNSTLKDVYSYGGNYADDFKSDIFVSVDNSSFAGLIGGGYGVDTFANPAPNSAPVYTHEGDITVLVFDSNSTSYVYGGSEFYNIAGNVSLYINACPYCDGGETDCDFNHMSDAAPVNTFFDIVGGSGNPSAPENPLSHNKFLDSNYGNIAGDVKVVISGNTSCTRWTHGGSHGLTSSDNKNIANIRKNNHGDGGNVTLVINGNANLTNVIGGCRNGVAENVTTTIGGNSVITFIFGSSYRSNVQGIVCIFVKDSASVTDICGGSWAGTTKDGEDNYIQDRVFVSMTGGHVKNLYSHYFSIVEIFQVHVKGGTVDNLFGGSYNQGVTDKAVITIDGGNVGVIYGGGANDNQGSRDCLVNSSSIIVNGGNIGKIYGGGGFRTKDYPSKVVDSEIIIKGGDVAEIYGGGSYSNTTVSSSKITLSGGKIGDVYLGGNGTKIEKSDLYLKGGQLVGKKIYGHGVNQNDPSLDITVHLYTPKTMDYIYYFDDDSLDVVKYWFKGYGAMSKFNVFKVLDPAAQHAYLFPYMLEKVEDTGGGGSKTPSTGSSESPDTGYVTESPDLPIEDPLLKDPINTVLLFVLAIAAFVYKRKEELE